MTTTKPAPADGVKTTLPVEFRNDEAPSPLATFLGLFSVGLGLAEVCAPGFMGRITGVRLPWLLRTYGARELMAGVGILTSRRPAGWLWARVAGDALDLATLGAVIANPKSDDDRVKAVTAATAVAGVTALDLVCAVAHS